MAKGIIYSVEDDEDIAHIIVVALSKASYEVKSFRAASSFFAAFKEKKPDLVLLDLMLPDVSGLDILKNIRSHPEDDLIQVIILSAKRMVMDKVDGLDLGADDYIEKPFDILELISRVNTRFRRLNKPKTLVYKNLSIDKSSHVFSLRGQAITLTDSEFDLLFLLMNKAGEVVTREEISYALYEEEAIEESRAIDMHIASLRKKLGECASLIKTIRGLGYKLGE